MRAILQRVSAANVKVDGKTIGAVDAGLMILLCAMEGDTMANVDAMARKIAGLRIFNDGDGRMNRSIRDIGGAALVVSQFTLAADTSRGNRPGFSQAAKPDIGKDLFEAFVLSLQSHEIAVQTGEFGAHMEVTLTNDGPVTISLDM